MRLAIFLLTLIACNTTMQAETKLYRGVENGQLYIDVSGRDSSEQSRPPPPTRRDSEIPLDSRQSDHKQAPSTEDDYDQDVGPQYFPGIKRNLGEPDNKSEPTKETQGLNE